jgi:DNA-binding MarR family transcriptional regulator
MHVSKLIRGLERTGLVERNSNPSDTRAMQLRVTARGAEVVAAARRIVLSMEDQRLAPLGGAQSKQSDALRRTLLTLLRHAEKTEHLDPQKPGGRFA